LLNYFCSHCKAENVAKHNEIKNVLVSSCNLMNELRMTMAGLQLTVA